MGAKERLWARMYFVIVPEPYQTPASPYCYCARALSNFGLTLLLLCQSLIKLRPHLTVIVLEPHQTSASPYWYCARALSNFGLTLLLLCQSSSCFILYKTYASPPVQCSTHRILFKTPASAPIIGPEQHSSYPL